MSDTPNILKLSTKPTIETSGECENVSIITLTTDDKRNQSTEKYKLSQILDEGQQTNSTETRCNYFKKILPKQVVVTDASNLPATSSKLVMSDGISIDGYITKEQEEIEKGKYLEKERDKKCEKEIIGSSTSKASRNKNSIGCSSVKKIPLKQLKSIETTLSLLEPENSFTRAKREEHYAEQYLIKVQQRLRGNTDLYEQFEELICDLPSNASTIQETFKKICEIFSTHHDLIEDFIPFLTPEQAVDCGVFMEHLMLTKMEEFLNMVDVYFAKSPHQIKKIHSVLEALSEKKDVTTVDVTSLILPLLKGNQVLTDYFLQLVPHGRPPENILFDYEDLECAEGFSDNDEYMDDVEVAHVPEIEDLYGGESCPCCCHKESSKPNHCNTCSTKYLNGKIFKIIGKTLRPAKVVFNDYDMEYHRERLLPKFKTLCKRSRKRSSNSSCKENQSPTKSCNLSSDEFKSDVEDEKTIRYRNKCLSPKRRTKQGHNMSSTVVREIKLHDTATDIAMEINDDTIKTEEYTEVDDTKMDIDHFDIDENQKTSPNQKSKCKPESIVIQDDIHIKESLKEEILEDETTYIKNEDNAVNLSLPELDDESCQKVEPYPWNIEEDRVILQTLQVEENCDETFRKISERIPSRGVKDIKERFDTLMHMLYAMKAKGESSSATN